MIYEKAGGHQCISYNKINWGGQDCQPNRSDITAPPGPCVNWFCRWGQGLRPHISQEALRLNAVTKNVPKPMGLSPGYTSDLGGEGGGLGGWWRLMGWWGLQCRCQHPWRWRKRGRGKPGSAVRGFVHNSLAKANERKHLTWIEGDGQSCTSLDKSGCQHRDPIQALGGTSGSGLVTLRGRCPPFRQMFPQGRPSTASLLSGPQLNFPPVALHVALS